MGIRPPPVPGTTIELGFLGSVLHVELPRDMDEQQLGNVTHLLAQPEQDSHVRSDNSFPYEFRVIIKFQLLACSPPFAALSMIHIFGASLKHLWSIWECLVLCEPIIIFGRSPAWTSMAIWWLRDVFRPVRCILHDRYAVRGPDITQIPWAGDFRPYFTIHDREHSALVNDRAPKAGLLLGVTNPFFEKTCSHWPHILTLVGNSR
jgi:Stabilization of polarity axis